MLFADVQVNIIPNQGLADLIFHQTWIKVNVLGIFSNQGGFTLTLAGLIILVVIGLAAAAVAERLSGQKVGSSLVVPTLLSLLGAFLFAAYVRLPFTDIVIEGIRLISSLIGAIIFGVFYVLLRRQAAPRAKTA